MTEAERHQRFRDEILPLRPALKRQARNLTRAYPGEAEDLLQDTLTHIFAKLHLLQPGTSPYSWSVTIQKNLWISQLRARARRVDPFYADDADLASWADREGHCTDSAEVTALNNWLDVPELKDALQAMPVQFAVAVYLADAEGWTYAEIAQFIGAPVGTVMSRIYRGRRKLAEQMEAS